MSLSHYELCKITADWFIKKADVCLFEYQSYASNEFPDVLAFKSSTSYLFEIKVEKQDFLRDSAKDSRKFLEDTTIKYNPRQIRQHIKTIDGKYVPVPSYYGGNKETTVRQFPHLGVFRYYVCPPELIKPEETKYFGLYWFVNGKFYLKKESTKFRRNLYMENSILVHALRKQINVGNDRLIVKPYK